jgi:hypothetical protein
MIVLWLYSGCNRKQSGGFADDPVHPASSITTIPRAVAGFAPVTLMLHGRFNRINPIFFQFFIVNYNFQGKI